MFVDGALEGAPANRTYRPPIQRRSLAQQLTSDDRRQMRRIEEAWNDFEEILNETVNRVIISLVNNDPNNHVLLLDCMDLRRDILNHMDDYYGQMIPIYLRNRDGHQFRYVDIFDDLVDEMREFINNEMFNA